MFSMLFCSFAALDLNEHDETTSDINQFNGALVFVHLPGSTRFREQQIVRNVKSCGAEVSQFFHRKITHFITSRRCVEEERKNKLTTNELFIDPSSGRANKKQSHSSVFEPKI